MLLEVKIEEQMVLVIKESLLGLVLEVFRSLVAVDLGQRLLFQTVCHFLLGQLELLKV